MPQALILTIVGLSLALSAGCREGGSGGGGSSTSATREIGPDGGTISTRDVELDIAPGTLALETEVSISQTSDAPAGHIGDAYELQPEGMTFDPPVTIRFEYDASDLDGADPSNLTIARASDGVWSSIPSVVDAEAGLVMASLTSFSTYAIIVEEGGGDGDADGDSDGDADGDADGDGDGDADGDADGDSDGDADCDHAMCSVTDTGCSCEWTCDGEPRFVWCSFTLGQCDCDSDETMDCELIDVPETQEACGDFTCCFR